MGRLKMHMQPCAIEYLHTLVTRALQVSQLLGSGGVVCATSCARSSMRACADEAPRRPLRRGCGPLR